MSAKKQTVSVGRMTIDRSREIKVVFIDLLSGSGEAVLDFEKTEEIDLAGIQLLVALFREATQKGVTLRCRGRLNDRVISRLRIFGLCDEACGTAEGLGETLGSLF